MRQLDQSKRLSDMIKALSVGLSAKRGLPLMAAIGLTVISLIVHIVAALSGSVLVMICGFTILHIAILVGFVGILMAEPLGRG